MPGAAVLDPTEIEDVTAAPAAAQSTTPGVSLSEGEFEDVTGAEKAKGPFHAPSRADMEANAPRVPVMPMGQPGWSDKQNENYAKLRLDPGPMGRALPEGLKKDEQIAAEAPFVTDPRTGERRQTTPMGQSFLDFPYRMYKHLESGVEASAAPLEAAEQDAGQRAMASAHPGAAPQPSAMTPEMMRQSTRAGTEFAKAGFEAATPLIVAGLAPIAAAGLGTAAASALVTGITVGAAGLSDVAVHKLLKSLDVPEEYAEAGGTLAAFAGGALGAKGVAVAGRMAGLLKNAAIRTMVRSILQDRLNRQYASGVKNERAARESAETGQQTRRGLTGETATAEPEDIQDVSDEPGATTATPPKDSYGIGTYRTSNGDEVTVEDIAGGKVRFTRKTASGTVTGRIPKGAFDHFMTEDGAAPVKSEPVQPAGTAAAEPPAATAEAPEAPEPPAGPTAAPGEITKGQAYTVGKYTYTVTGVTAKGNIQYVRDEVGGKSFKGTATPEQFKARAGVEAEALTPEAPPAAVPPAPPEAVRTAEPQQESGVVQTTETPAAPEAPVHHTPIVPGRLDLEPAAEEKAEEKSEASAEEEGTTSGKTEEKETKEPVTETDAPLTETNEPVTETTTASTETSAQHPSGFEKGQTVWFSGMEGKVTGFKGDNIVIERDLANGGKAQATVSPDRVSRTAPAAAPEVSEDVYKQAVEIVRQNGKASTSTLQRALRLGYGAASRVLDRMEKEGIIGPADGSKPREILQPGVSRETGLSQKEEVSAEPEQKLSSTQVNLPGELASHARNFAGDIPASELAGKGREDELHITARYGTHTNEPADVRKLVADEEPITATVGRVSVFPASEATAQRGGEQYDVVKVDIDSPDLHRLNEKLGALEHTDSHPVYQPHITLAYVKPGEGAKYVGREVPGLTGQTVTFNHLTFSGHDGAHTEIALTGKKAEAPAATQKPAKQRGYDNSVDEFPVTAVVRDGVIEVGARSKDKKLFSHLKIPLEQWEKAEKSLGNPAFAKRGLIRQELDRAGKMNPEAWFIPEREQTHTMNVDRIVDAHVGAIEKALNGGKAPAAAEKKPEVPPIEDHLSLQKKIDAAEDALEAKGIDPVKLYDPAKYKPGDLPADYRPMPPELAELHRQADALQAADDAALDRGVGEQLEHLIPDAGVRDKFVRTLTQTDRPPAIRGNTGREKWRDLGRIANEVLRFAREEAGEDSFTDVESRLAGTPENPGHQLVLRQNHGTTPYPSDKVFDRAQELFNAVIGDKAPELPRPGKPAPVKELGSGEPPELKGAEGEEEPDLSKESGSSEEDILASVLKGLGESGRKAPKKKASGPRQQARPREAPPRQERGAKEEKSEEPKAGRREKTEEEDRNPLRGHGNAARERMRNKARGSTLNSGIDPQDLIDLATIGAEHMLDGALKFIDWSKKMSEDVGDLLDYVGKQTGLARDSVLRQVHKIASRAAREYGAEPEATPAKAKVETELKPNGPADAQGDHALEDQLPEGGAPPAETGDAEGTGGAVRQTGDGSGDAGNGEGNELESGEGTGDPGVGNPADAGLTPTEERHPPKSPSPGNTRHEHDYRIPDGRIISGSPEVRARNNITALRTLREIQKDGRPATIEEQRILAQYVGWGAVPQLFAGNTEAWKAVQDELHSVLNDEEYADAQRSTTNAHFTSDVVVDAMWGVVDRFGARPGMAWLEPAVGAGVFFGRQPAHLLEGARRVGLDKDSVVAQITKQLYPDSGIDNVSYESAELPDDYFDGAISNIPFGHFGVHDATFRGKKFLTNPIHNYFFAKSLMTVRPGGIIAFVTSRYTMDGSEGGHTAFRKWVADRADFIGAVRLPSGAFRQNAGTEVITDLVFIRRRVPGAEPAGEDWTGTTTKVLAHANGSRHPIEVNSYYDRHPEMILGRQQVKGGQFSDHDYDVAGTLGPGILEDALGRLPQNQFQEWSPAGGGPKATAIREIGAGYESKLGGFFFDKDGNLFRKKSKGAAIPIPVGPGVRDRIRGQLGIRDQAVALMDAERSNIGDDDLDKLRADLNKAYDSYVKQKGPLSSASNRRAMSGDPDAPLMLSLERNHDPELKKADKGPILLRRMLQPPKAIEFTSDPKEALSISLNNNGRIDWDHMAKLTGRSPEQLQAELAGLVFLDPASKSWQTADEYLSGAVRTKLRMARAVAKLEPQYEGNIKALEAAQPIDIPPGQIRANLGVTWVPLETYAKFIQEIAGAAEPPEVRYVAGEWSFEAGKPRTQFDTDRVNGLRLIEDAMNMRKTKVYDRGDNGPVLNSKETAAAYARQQEIQEYFENWLFSDADRGQHMTRLYNDVNNDLKRRVFDGSHLTLPGMTRDPAIVRGGNLSPGQLAGVWRQISQRNVMLAHAVGFGKTFEMIAAGMELKRLGLVQRPMYVVPIPTLPGWQEQFSALYPQARVIVFGEGDLVKQKRQEAMARIATGEWDAVVVPHSSFGLLRTGDEMFNEHYARLEAELRDQISEAQGAGMDTRLIKRMETANEALLTNLMDRRNAERQDIGITWEQLGIDQLFVDEFHEFKRLGFATKSPNIAGIDQGGNQRTFDMLMKIRHVQKHGRGVVVATGTPVTNTMGEVYSMMRYMIEPELQARGLARFDEWKAAFGRTIPSFEPKPEGGGYQMKDRFAKFVNLPELGQLFSSFADVVTSDMVDLAVPKLFTGGREPVVTELNEEQMAAVNRLRSRARAIRSNPSAALPDNMLHVYSDAAKIALDARTMDRSASNDPAGRIAQAADIIYRHWHDSAENRGIQQVFLDFSKPMSEGPKPFSAYDALIEQLVEKGIPREEIAHVYQAKNKDQRTRLFHQVNEGRIRVIIGSRAKMGQGVNIQKRAYAQHHLDIPPRPDQLEQSEGRILRQGNMYPEVHIHYYMTRGSLDENKFSNVVRKGKFITAFLKGDSSVREMEDLEGMVPSLEEFQALTSGDPRVLRVMELRSEVDRLSAVFSAWRNQEYYDRIALANDIPNGIRRAATIADEIGKLIETRDATGRTWTLGTGDAAETWEGEGIGGKVGPVLQKQLQEIFEGKRGTKIIGSAYGIPLKSDGTWLSLGAPGSDIYIRDYAAGNAEASRGLFTTVENAIKRLNANRQTELDQAAQLKADEKTLSAKVGKPWAHQVDYDRKVTELERLERELAPQAAANGAAGVADGHEVVATGPAEAADQEESLSGDITERENAGESEEESDEGSVERSVAVTRPALRPGGAGAMTAYRKGRSAVEPSDTYSGWLTGEVDGKPVYSDGGFILEGKAPAGKLSDQKVDFAKFMAPASEEKSVTALAFSKLGKGKDAVRVVWFNGEGVDKPVAIKSEQYDLIRKEFPKATFTAARVGAHPVDGIYVTAKGRKVGVVMPMMKAEPPDTITDLLEPGSGGGRLSSEAGSLLLDPGQWFGNKFGNDVARENYTGIGGVAKRIFQPGQQLIQVEKASKAVATSAVRAGGSRSQAQVIRAAGPIINKTLSGTGFTYDDQRLGYMESRLRALREFWGQMSDTAMNMTDEQAEKAIMTGNDDDGRSPLMFLLSTIEGRAGLAQDLGQTAMALAQEKDWEMLRAHMAQAFGDASERVGTVMDPDRFDALKHVLKDTAAGREAERQYQKLVEEPIRVNHELNEGVVTDKLGELGHWHPLIAEQRSTTPVQPGKRTPYRKLRNPGNYFATGLSDAYDASIEAFADRVPGYIRANDRASLVQTMLDTKWAQKEPNEWDGYFEGPDGITYEGVKEEFKSARTIIKNGKAFHVKAQYIIMPKFMQQGLKPILAREPMESNDVLKILSWVNMLTTKGPFELVFHGAGMFGAMNLNTPFLRDTGLGKLLSAPFIKWMDLQWQMIGRPLVSYATGGAIDDPLNPRTPENLKILQELAKSGALAARYGEVTYSKKYAAETGAKLVHFPNFEPMLWGPSGLDARARILMYKLGQSIPNWKPLDIYHFVNQIGNYTPEFQGVVERWAKKTGLGSFFTAGSTRIINSAHAWTGTGPGPGKSKMMRIWRWSSGTLMMVGLWVAAYKFLTGKWPTQDKNAKLGYIPLDPHGHGRIDKYRRSAWATLRWGKGDEVGYINFWGMGGANLLNRVAPHSAFEAYVQGGDATQIFDALMKDMENTALHPLAGPAVRAATAGTFGSHLYITNAESRGDMGLHFMSAIPQKRKPGFLGGLSPETSRFMAAKLPGWGIGSKEAPKKNAGLPSRLGAQAAATFRELNSLGSYGGDMTGMLGPDQGEQGSAWFRMATDLGMPGTFGRPVNVNRKVENLRKERAGRR